MENYEDFEQSKKMQRPGKFNFGAFMLPIPWGIAHRCYLPLLTLIPVFNLIWIFVCGFRGNDWAMKNNHYRDELEFSRVQMPWHRLGVVLFTLTLLSISFILLLMMLGIAAYH
ncbi:MAG: ribonuclease G [Tissierellia bacterium]|nr:ribonuclease G [Tissierellia bacterium]